MKAPYKILITLVLILFFFSCKPDSKEDKTPNNTKKAEITKIEASENKRGTQEIKESIEDFLKKLQTAIKETNITTIEESVKLPFEYQSGGESSFYQDINRLIKNPHFKKITKAKFEKIESGDIYSILYEQPENEDFFIYYYAIKNKDGFKLIKLEMPH